MSDLDEVHDRFIPSPTIKKKGTKYERLVALVAAFLERDGAVVHNVRIRGDSDALRQIDVKITRHESNQRVLIECKDFDVSGEKVGVEIVDRFVGVLDDIEGEQPDEAWIVTCNGFTRDAQKVAKRKNIKLVILRRFREEDWQERVQSLTLQMVVKVDSNHQLNIVTFPEDQELFEQELDRFGRSQHFKVGASGIELTLPDGSPIDAATWLEQQRESFDALHSEEGHYEASFPLPGAKVSLGGGTVFRIQGLKVEYDVTGSTYESVITAGEKIAELLLKGLGHDMIIWDEDLQQFDIDSEGNATARGTIEG